MKFFVDNNVNTAEVYEAAGSGGMSSTGALAPGWPMVASLWPGWATRRRCRWGRWGPSIALDGIGWGGGMSSTGAEALGWPMVAPIPGAAIALKADAGTGVRGVSVIIFDPGVHYVRWE